MLIQWDKNSKRRKIRYYSKALNETEQNYNILDREFMSVVFGLRNWRHLLVGSPHKVVVYTDHANLQYYQHLQKINQRVAQYISTLADYNLELRHLPRVKNQADPLSRQPDHDDGSNDNKHITALPNELFAQVIKTMAVDQQIRQDQIQNSVLIDQWQKNRWMLQKRENTWWKETALVVTKPEEFQKGLLETYHNCEMAGHPGVNRTYHQVSRDYWWPKLRKFVWSYVKGCGVCQQNKNPEPFKVISVDLIMKLPELKGNDAILTLMDQGLTKAVILIPCSKTMGVEQLACLYKEWVFPFIRVPSKLISDQDVQFTSHFFKEICKQLGVQQNISSAYHLEMDGQSKRTNQTVETALRIIRNFQQDD